MGENSDIPILNRYRPAGKVRNSGLHTCLAELIFVDQNIQSVYNLICDVTQTRLRLQLVFELLWAAAGGYAILGESIMTFIETGKMYSPSYALTPRERSAPELLQVVGTKTLTQLLQSVMPKDENTICRNQPQTSVFDASTAESTMQIPGPPLPPSQPSSVGELQLPADDICGSLGMLGPYSLPTDLDIMPPDV